MTVGKQILDIARNVNRTSASISAQCVDLLNSWQRETATRWPYMPTLETSAMITISGGTATYALSANIEKLYTIYIPNQSIALKRLTLEQLRTLAPSGSSITGTPTHWAPFGNQQIVLFPTPAESFDVTYEYYKESRDVSATTDTIDSIDDKYHDVGNWYASWRMAQRMGDNETMAVAKQEYEQAFQSQLADMARRFAGRNRVKGPGSFAPNTLGDDDVVNMFWR